MLTKEKVAAPHEATHDERVHNQLEQWAVRGRQALHGLSQLVSSPAFMAAVTALALIIFLWNAPHAIDYPEWDEATYFARGFALFSGQLPQADVFNVTSSPLYVAYNALWYAVLRTPLTYPWVFASSIFLVGIGAYALLSRLFHPVLSWLLAVAIVVMATPVVPWNSCYYFGAGLLWLSLSLLGKSVLRRGLAAAGVLLACLVRPEFFLCLGLLLLGLVFYEWREWRRGNILQESIAISYAPALIGLLLVGIVALTGSHVGYDRVGSAIPWSYNDWYNSQHSPLFQGNFSYDHPWILFEHDFGPVSPHTLFPTLLAMLRNPAKLGGYLIYDLQVFWASFATAGLHSYQWSYDASATKLPISANEPDIPTFNIAVVILGAALGACYLALRRRHALKRLPIHSNPAALLGILSLTGIAIWLVLLLPQQRFFMIYPLVLLPVGYGLSCAGAYLSTRVSLPAWSLGVLVAVLLVAIPHPYSRTPDHPVTDTLDFIQANVANGSQLLTESSETYAQYLAADGFTLNVMEASMYTEPVLVNAFTTNPALQYVLITHDIAQSEAQRWFADWNKEFPGTPWTSVARLDADGLQLYALPEHDALATKVTYLQFLNVTQSLGLPNTGLPDAAAIDFGQKIAWRGQSKAVDVQPTERYAYGVSASCIIMHPTAPGVGPTIGSQVTSTLPAVWSGRSLYFLAALAPWASDQPGAEGVKFDVTVAGTPYDQVFDIPNVAPPRWSLVRVDLPQYAGTKDLTVTIKPRQSVNNDTTFWAFLGVSLHGGS